MIHELSLQAVKRKLCDFDHVPRFINACEITCALGIAYQQASLPLPQLTPGIDIMDALQQLTPAVLSNSRVDDNIKEALQKYFKLGELVTEDAIITMKLGYDAKLPTGKSV
jgi:hypothetical protein